MGVFQVNKIYLIRRNERDYIQVGSGVSMSYLRKEADEYSLVLKMEPGSRFPMHGHHGGEQIYVVNGRVKIGQFELNEGDYFFTPFNHTQTLETEEGCNLLVCSAKKVDAAHHFSQAETTA
ncbi:hypothetical protein ADL26_08985 [Thermoactinomyces vulgaris]|nr:hypothetical protein ADL26_08985 [Thermoactinomyces vulgaris]